MFSFHVWRYDPQTKLLHEASKLHSIPILASFLGNQPVHLMKAMLADAWLLLASAATATTTTTKLITPAPYYRVPILTAGFAPSCCDHGTGLIDPGINALPQLIRKVIGSDLHIADAMGQWGIPKKYGKSPFVSKCSWFMTLCLDDCREDQSSTWISCKWQFWEAKYQFKKGNFDIFLAVSPFSPLPKPMCCSAFRAISLTIRCMIKSRSVGHSCQWKHWNHWIMSDPWPPARCKCLL